MKVKDITKVLETLAPLDYAESFDNVGLLVGDANAEVTGVLITLDTLEAVVEEAIEKNCNLIVSFHPIIFSGLKSLTGKTYVERVVMKAIRHQIAIYSMHTALDNQLLGVNASIADRLGLHNRSILIPQPNVIRKLITYVPKANAEKLRKALFEAGAGNIGNYAECSFNLEGKGTYKGNESSRPTIGEPNVFHTEDETQIGVIFPKHLQSQILKALRQNHPYEEVAYEVLNIVEPTSSTQYLGRVGRLPNALNLDSFREWVQEALPDANIRFAGIVPKAIQSIALCSGAGAEFIKDAARLHIDAYITGDVKYHEAQMAKELGLLVVDAGHFGTESIVAHGLRDYLISAGLTVPVKAFTEQNDFFFV